MSYPPPQVHFMSDDLNYSGEFLPEYRMQNQQPYFDNHVNPRLNPVVNSQLFYKTRICSKFKEGTCRYGAEMCNFAHGFEDLREPPPNWKELIPEEDRSPFIINDRMGRKMKICINYNNGEQCPYGENCKFLHERPQYQRENSAIHIETTGELKEVFKKTKLCYKWENDGHCVFGDRCNYAHGVTDLRAVNSQVDELVMNPGPDPNKTLQSPAFNEEPVNMVIGATSNDAAHDQKAMRWKTNTKINSIYGDWLDVL